MTTAPAPWLRRLVLALLLAAPATVWLDARLQTALYAWGGGHFPAAELPWFKFLLHDAAKWPVILLFLAALATGAASLLHPPWRTWRRPLAVLLLGMSFGAGTVSALKAVSPVACPADERAYGGELIGGAFWQWQLSPRPAGRCWPGGHASTGFCLIAGYFAARRAGRPRLARGSLWTALVYGNVLGLAQVLRGEHYLSHQFWTLLVCALAAWGADRLLAISRRNG